GENFFESFFFFIPTYFQMRPATDVYVEGDTVIVHVDLPGVPKADICIDTNDSDQLTVHGEARSPYEFKAATSHVRERNIGRFRKIIKLPIGCDLTNVTATYKDGLLEIAVKRRGVTQTVPIA
ncbi:hypothetical protein HMI55_006516, partial [Coelomomyces lativittatus]